MDTIQWVVLFLILFFLAALIIPNKYSNRSAADLKAAIERKKLANRKPTCEVIGPCKRECRYNSLNAEKDRYDHKADIDIQFARAAGDVPDDYPTQKIGCCPYGKPQSRDLPVADVPMCMAMSSKDMRLHELKMI